MVKRGLSVILAACLFAASFSSPIKSYANEYEYDVIETEVIDDEEPSDDVEVYEEVYHEVAEEGCSDDAVEDNVNQVVEDETSDCIKNKEYIEALEGDNLYAVKEDDLETIDEQEIVDDSSKEFAEDSSILLGEGDVITSGTCGENLTWTLTRDGSEHTVISPNCLHPELLN